MVEYERGLGALLFAVAGDGSLSGVDGSVGDLDDIPVAVRLVRMTGEQFEDYRTTADAQYAADLVRSGTLSEVEARAKAAAEQACRDLGVAAVGLTVSGPNLSARHLYEELGFEVTAVRVVRQLW